MTPAVGFVLFFVVTLVFLAAAVVTGKLARRKLHFPAVAFAIASLLTTIYYAERLGEHYDVKATGWIFDVHMAFAKTGTAAYVLPLITGIWTIKNPSGRRVHSRVAFLVLTITVLAAGTGLWMILAAEPLPS